MSVLVAGEGAPKQNAGFTFRAINPANLLRTPSSHLILGAANNRWLPEMAPSFILVGLKAVLA